MPARDFDSHIAMCRGANIVPLFWNVRNRVPKSGHKCIQEHISPYTHKTIGWSFKINIRCQDFCKNKYFKNKIDALCYKFGMYLLYIATQRKKYNIPYK